MTFRDKYNYLHHTKVKDGNPETSENAPCYDGCNIAWKYRKGKLYANDAWEYVHRVQKLYGYVWNEAVNGVSVGAQLGWRTTPVSTKFEMSHDNWKGIFMGLECCEKKSKKWDDKDLLNHIKMIKKKIPIFHKQLDHPRDFLLVVGFKYKWLRPFTTWAMKLGSIVSMYQTHKHKNNPERPPQAKTDGKIIGKCLCIAFDWAWTEKLMDKMLPMKRKAPLPDNAWHLVNKHGVGGVEINKDFRWSWDSWWNINMDYFNDRNHENCLLTEDL